MTKIYYQWLQKKLKLIQYNIGLGSTIQQAIYLSCCSGIIKKNNKMKLQFDNDVFEIVKQYKLDPYTKNLSIYFSTLIYYGEILFPDIFKDIYQDIQKTSEKKLLIEQIIEYYVTVQRILHQNYVFPFCIINAKQKLQHSPKDFWNKNNQKFDQINKDAIFTLWHLAQKDTNLKHKLFFIPHLPPYLGYDKDSFTGDFHIFYNKKDDIYVTRQKINNLFQKTPTVYLLQDIIGNDTSNSPPKNHLTPLNVSSIWKKIIKIYKSSDAVYLESTFNLPKNFVYKSPKQYLILMIELPNRNYNNFIIFDQFSKEAESLTPLPKNDSIEIKQFIEKYFILYTYIEHKTPSLFFTNKKYQPEIFRTLYGISKLANPQFTFEEINADVINFMQEIFSIKKFVSFAKF